MSANSMNGRGRKALGYSSMIVSRKEDLGMSRNSWRFRNKKLPATNRCLCYMIGSARVFYYHEERPIELQLSQSGHSLDAQADYLSK